jgi:HSP20 family molecular chaperone IbpA
MIASKTSKKLSGSASEGHGTVPISLARGDDLTRPLTDMLKSLSQNAIFNFRPCETWQPAMNFYESAEAYFICLDLSGVHPDDIDVQADQDVLKISGHRPTPRPVECAAARIDVMEIDHGRFQRIVQIPADVDHDRIRATHHNGLVWIHLPRTSASR